MEKMVTVLELPQKSTHSCWIVALSGHSCHCQIQNLRGNYEVQDCARSHGDTGPRAHRLYSNFEKFNVYAIEVVVFKLSCQVV